MPTDSRDADTDKIEHPGRRRPAGEAAGPGDRPGGAGAERRHGALRRGGAAAGAGARLRRHPARRQHAGHGRLRDGRADPPPQEVGAHADHLHHRLRRRDAHRPGLLAGRGGLHPVAGRAGGAADQGQGVRRSVPHDAAGASSRPTSAWRWRRSRRPGRRPRRPRAARPSWPRPARSWPARSTSRRPLRGLAPPGGALPGRPGAVTCADESGQPWQTEIGLGGPPSAPRQTRTEHEGRHSALACVLRPWPVGGAGAGLRASRVRGGWRVPGIARRLCLSPAQPAPTGRPATASAVVILPLRRRGRTLGVLALAHGRLRPGSARRPGPGRGPRRPRRHRPGQRPALPRHPGGRPPQERVPGHAGPRAAQPAGPDPQRRADPAAARRATNPDVRRGPAT